jgi:hypothetical protein
MASYTWLQEKYDLDEFEAAAVEWQYRFCGDFHSALWRAIDNADPINLHLLASGFPVYVKSYTLFAFYNDWWPDVQKKIPFARSELKNGK